MRNLLARRHFTELDYLEHLIEQNSDLLRVQVVDQVSHGSKTYPLYCVEVGSEDPAAPVLGFFGGVHGLEKIGSEVVLSQLATVIELMKWDHQFRNRLQSSRMLFMPIVNPVGIVLRQRSNGNGVDLMRNSPLEGEEGERQHLYRGHRVSPLLPWYRGGKDNMERESQALCKVVEEKMFASKLAFALDVHSGFGARDRLWFPFAHSRKPFPFIAEMFALKELYDRTYAHHFYEIEPVSKQYTIHGDLWDYLFLKKYSKGINTSEVFIPWTLEMGSWIWIKKNPLQALTAFGVFNPVKPHRYHRILRRHLSMFDFMHRLLLSKETWLSLPTQQRDMNLQKALRLWFESEWQKGEAS